MDEPKNPPAETDARPLPGAMDDLLAPVRQFGEETSFIFWASEPNLARIKFSSPAYDRIWGRPREAMYEDPRAFVEGIHPDDRERVMGADFTQVVRGVVYRVVRPDGSERVVRSWAIPLRDDAGNVEQIVGMTEDITDAQKATQDLEQRNRQLLALHDITRATYGVQSLEMMVRTIAGHIAATTGFPTVLIERWEPSRGMLVLEGAAGLDPSDDTPTERDATGWLDAAVATGGVHVAQEPWHGPGDARLYGTRVGTLLAVPKTSGGRLVGLLTIAHPDAVPIEPALIGFVETLANHLAAVLERRRTEQALRASEELFRDVAEQVHQAIMLLDVITGVPTYVSPGWARIFQRDPAALADGVTAVVPWIHPDDRARLGKLLDLSRTASGGGVAEDRYDAIEFRIHRPDGTMRWLRARGSRMRNVRGEVTHILGLAEDVTQEKERLAELEAAVDRATARVRELERQRAELDRLAMAGRMAARIAHEINNPLASIKNAFFLVRDALSATPEHRGWLERIDREIERIARVVRQMYELYRPETGRGRANVALAVAAAVDVYAAEAQERDVTVSTELPDRRHTAPVADALLREVVAAVVQNAIEACPRGGTVRVTASVGPEAIDVAVSDDGPGIPEDARARVFEPFFTTKAPRAAVHGFGLTIVKSIVDALGGRVVVGDAPGGGACVRVHLPTAAPMA